LLINYYQFFSKVENLLLGIIKENRERKTVKITIKNAKNKKKPSTLFIRSIVHLRMNIALECSRASKKRVGFYLCNMCVRYACIYRFSGRDHARSSYHDEHPCESLACMVTSYICCPHRSSQWQWGCENSLATGHDRLGIHIYFASSRQIWPICLDRRSSSHRSQPD
jgi:hypothetical protein